jgi:hypothetical protein
MIPPTDLSAVACALSVLSLLASLYAAYASSDPIICVLKQIGLLLVMIITSLTLASISLKRLTKNSEVKGGYKANTMSIVAIVFDGISMILCIVAIVYSKTRINV